MKPLTEQLPDCKWCDQPATRWRIDQNAFWGFTDTHQPARETDSYAIWAERGVPPDTYGTCAAHFFSRLDESGDLVESAAGRRANRLPTIRLTRAQRLSQDRQELRLALIAKLGGECETCSETSPDLLNIRTYVSRPDDARRGIAWYQWLMAHPEVLASSELRCLRHAAREPDEYRRAVIRAYGGGCSCGETDALQILPMSGTEAPRYPGGRKYSAKDKVRWLAREGFPTGWRLACPDHRD